MDTSISWLAVIVSAIVYFMIGWVWYSPVLFYKVWIKASGIDASKAGQDKGKMMRGIAGSFVVAIVVAIALAVLLRSVHADGIGLAIAWSLLASIGFLATVTASNALFQGKNLTHYLIDTGYPVVGYVVMAAILTLWK